MKNLAANPDPSAEEIRGVGGFLKKFSVLGGAMPELWVVFIIKLFIIAGYGLMNSTLVLWLSYDFGFSDQKALGLVGAWALIMSFFNVLSGSLVDAIGFRKTFFWGTSLAIASRLVMVFSTNFWIAAIFGLAPLAIGEAMTGPVLVAAVRTYSNTKQRSMSFSLIYAIMNGGFLLANFLFDSIRQHVGEHGHYHLFGTDLSTYRMLLFASVILEAAVLPFIFLLREGAEATDEGVRINPKKARTIRENPFMTAVGAIQETAVDAGRLFGKLISQAGFYRLLMFLIFIAFIKLVYRQLDYVFPQYGLRTMGAGAPIGRLLGINNILILVLTPIVGALTERWPAYPMVIVGGFVSAVSVFIMAMPVQMFEPFTHGFFGDWYGHWYLNVPQDQPVLAVYVMVGFFQLVLSLGEALYSPRVYEYAAAIAPKGQEASYSALSYVPILLAKLLTGLISGTLLAKYCPAVGARNPAMMWVIIGVAMMIAPFGLAALSGLIRSHEEGRG